MYLSQSVLALQEWLWRDWYGVWAEGGGVVDFWHGAGEGVIGEGVVGGVWGVRCME